MTRQHQRGLQNTLIRIFPPASLFCPVRISRKILCSAVAVLTLLAAPVLLAQTSDVDDIHVRPRISADDVAKTTMDSALADTVRPHAPMIKSKVDLVLVPVTVTDPEIGWLPGSTKRTSRFTRAKIVRNCGISPARMRPFRSA